MQLTKNFLPVLLAASAAAAPHSVETREDDYLQIAEKQGRSVGTVAKRQYAEILDFAGPRIDYLLEKVFGYLEGASDDGNIITRQIQGKASDFACIGDEKKVAPRWLENHVKPQCATMTSAPEGSLVSSTFPNAMMARKWAARQNADDGGHDGDWVDIDLAWSQIPNFNGEHAKMSTALCEEIIQYGMDICATGNPSRVQGFYVVHNREWGFNLDVTNIDDSDAENAYGHTYDLIEN